MQTNLADFIKDTPEGKQADAILRKCVHCGFCTATCPTYQLLGDELDGPRGRIYLIREVLEGKQATSRTQLHLDRCLTCRNCESTCPSGVQYGRLVDIGRKVVEDQVPRSPFQRLLRTALKEILPRKWLFAPIIRAGQLARPLLPSVLKDKVPVRRSAGTIQTRAHKRKMLLLEGCVQPAMAPNINAATVRVLDRLGVQTLVARNAGCCGAIRHHMNDHEGGLHDVRRNIDAWWPYVEEGVEAIVVNASGCGTMVKDYGTLLEHDPTYAFKAKNISELAKDLSEVLPDFEDELRNQLPERDGKRVTYHPPCTLQHGQQIRGKVESLLRMAGIDVNLCKDSHLCCGSAGTYSVLQPRLATELRDKKIENLHATQPDMIVSANIGCIMHLQSATHLDVLHWIELLDWLLENQKPSPSPLAAKGSA